MSAISDETQKMIEDQVKKGKARKFFLIYKGASIKTLVVFKKGAFGPKIVAAKKEGFKGEVVYGVVTGSGKNLFFQLAGTNEVASAMKVESWTEKPPTKKAKLREFLADAGLRFKPSYHIIMDPTQAPDPDAESNVPVAPPPPGSEAGDDDGGGAPVENDLDEVPTPSPTPDPAPQSTPPPAPPLPDSEGPTFMARLKVLKPDLQKVIEAQVSVSEDAKLLASEAGTFARKKDFAQANRILDRLKELVEQGLEQAGKKAEASGDPGELFKKRLAGLLPRIKQAAGTSVGDEAKLKASEAGLFARKADFEQANALLDEVDRLLKSSVPEGEGVGVEQESPKESPVDWKTAKSKWQDVSDTIDSQIAKLQSVLKQSDDEELVEIGEFGLNALTGNFKVPLMAVIRDIDGGDDDARSKAARKALGIIADFSQHISNSEEVDAVDNNPFGVQLSIRSSLLDAFKVMENALRPMTAS